MRVQHNIVAMNSYRNYNNNTKGINKNLEKLSSGYKINRAGDDAAGLAISEKMRAQITGLEGAQKNAKDGISLVQTAEGALTEVHSMLNRMYSLAEQSANGTYDSSTDRLQLQKEVEQLSKEIDRIADSSNFNGLKLLDGSMSKAGASSSAVTNIDVSKMGIDITADAEELNAVKGKYTAEASGTSYSMASNAKVEINVNYTVDGQEKTKTLTLYSGGSDGKTLYIDDGSEDGIQLNSKLASANTLKLNGDINAVKEAFQKFDSDFVNLFKVSSSAEKKLEFESTQNGSAGAVLTGIEINTIAKNGTKTVDKAGVSVTTKPLDANKAYDLSKAKIWDNTATADTATVSMKLDDAIFEVNGEKFVFVQKGTVDDALKEKLAAAGIGNNYVEVGEAGTIGNKDVDDVGGMAAKIGAATGLKVETGTVANGVFTDTTGTANQTKKIRFTASTTSSSTGAGGLTLQIGDTAEEWNQLKVEIDDIHVKALKIHDVDISQQGGAQKAMDALKTAINTVSDVRGTLGATQNRLEHTINNLSVMQENIQDAESTIRDTDVADEMMKYTKNSILVQSAQAMLAQANQQPQGVLQLLQ